MYVDYMFRHNNNLIRKGSVEVDFDEAKRQFRLRLEHSSIREVYTTTMQEIESFTKEKSEAQFVKQLLTPSLLGNSDWMKGIQSLQNPGSQPIIIAIDYLTFYGSKQNLYRLSTNEECSLEANQLLCEQYFDDISGSKGIADSSSAHCDNGLTLDLFLKQDDHEEHHVVLHSSKVKSSQLNVDGLDNDLMKVILETTNIKELLKDKELVFNSLSRTILDKECDYESAETLLSFFYAFNQSVTDFKVDKPKKVVVVISTNNDEATLQCWVDN